MRNRPRGVAAPAASFLFGLDAPVAAPLATGEYRTADDSGELLDGVPFPHLLALDQDQQQCLDFLKPFFLRHAAPAVYSSLSGDAMTNTSNAIMIQSMTMLLKKWAGREMPRASVTTSIADAS